MNCRTATSILYIASSLLSNTINSVPLPAVRLPASQQAAGETDRPDRVGRDVRSRRHKPTGTCCPKWLFARSVKPSSPIWNSKSPPRNAFTIFWKRCSASVTCRRMSHALLKRQVEMEERMVEGRPQLCQQSCRGILRNVVLPPRYLLHAQRAHHYSKS